MVAVEFKKRTEITKETGLHSGYPDFWDGMGSLFHNATAADSGTTGSFSGTSATGFYAIKGGETPIKYLMSTQVADQPSFGAGKLKRLDLNYYVDSIALGNSPEPHVMSSYKVEPNSGYTGLGRLDIVTDKIVAISGTATNENTAWAENFTGSDFLEDAGIYENIHRVVKDIAGQKWMLVSEAYQHARYTKGGVHIKGQQLHMGAYRGRGAGRSSGTGNPPYNNQWPALTQAAFRKKWCAAGENSSQKFAAAKAGNPLSVKVCHIEKDDEGHWRTVKTSNKKHAYFKEDDIKKIVRGHTVVSNTTEGYGNEVSPVNTRFTVVTGSSEYTAEETEDESAKVHGVARSRFSTKKVLRNSQSMEMLAIWNYNSPDLCSYELGTSKRNLQQTMVCTDILPAPTNYQPSYFKAMGFDDSLLAHNKGFPGVGSSLCLDINIDKMAWAFKYDSDEGSAANRKFAITERAFVIMLGNKKPKYNQTLYEYIDTMCTLSNDSAVTGTSGQHMWGWAFMKRGTHGDTSTDSDGEISIFDASTWYADTGTPDRIYVPANTAPSVAGFPMETWVRLKIMQSWHDEDMKVKILSVDKSGNETPLEGVGSGGFDGETMANVNTSAVTMCQPATTFVGDTSSGDMFQTDGGSSADSTALSRGTVKNAAAKYLSLWVVNSRCQNNGSTVDTLVEDINSNSSSIESEAVVLDSNFDCVTKVFVDSIQLKSLNWNHSNASVGDFSGSRLTISSPQKIDASYTQAGGGGVVSVSNQFKETLAKGAFHLSFGFEDINDVAHASSASPKYLLLNDYKAMAGSNTAITTTPRGETSTSATQREAPNGWLYAYNVASHEEIGYGQTSTIFDQTASGATMGKGHRLLGREIELTNLDYGVKSFTQKGFIRFNFADSDFVKRENHYCAAKILRAINESDGIYEVDNTDIFKNYSTTEYIAYLWGAPRKEHSTERNKKCVATGIKLIEILGPRRVQLEWNGYSENDEQQLINETVLPYLWISPYLYWVGIVGYNAEDTTTPGSDGSISLSKPLAERSYLSAIMVEPITQNSVTYDLEMTLDDTTPSHTAWQASQTHYNVAQTSSSDDGEGAKFDITTDGAGAATVTVISPGTGYDKGDTIVLTDPGSTSNTATVTVKNIAASNNKFILGATFNETEFTEPTGLDAASYLKPWAHDVTVDMPNILDLKDYGFGGVEETDEGDVIGGHTGEKLAVSGEYNTLKMFDIVSTASIEPSDEIDFMLMSKNSTIDHEVKIRGIAALYQSDGTPISSVNGDYHPYLLSVFEDEQPNVPMNFKVGPWTGDEDSLEMEATNVNPYLPMFTWETSDSDLWYGILHVDDIAIQHQYHQAMAHIPLNEDNVGNNALIATTNTTPPKAYPYRHSAATSYNVAAVDVNPRTTYEGLAGNAVYFPGSGAQLRFSDNSISTDGSGGNPTTAFTVLAHIIPDAGSTAGTIVAKGLNMHLAGGFDYMLSMTATDTIEGKICWDTTKYVKVTSSTKVIRDGETPTMVALVLDTELKNGNVKLYINGVLEDQTGVRMASPTGTADAPFTAYNNWKTGETMQYGTSETYIGGNANHTTAADFIGIIEEVVIWDKAINFISPEDNKFILHKPLRETVGGDSGSSKSYNARLFIKDYHNIRGKSNEDVTCTPQISWRKAGVRVAG